MYVLKPLSVLQVPCNGVLPKSLRHHQTEPSLSRLYTILLHKSGIAAPKSVANVNTHSNILVDKLQAASERQAFNAEDFPSVSGGPGGGGVMSGGRWAAAGGAAGGRITAEDFPALPGWRNFDVCHAVPNAFA